MVEEVICRDWAVSELSSTSGWAAQRACRADGPAGVFPAADQPVVATERAVPRDMSGRAVQEGDDFAATATTARTTPDGTFVYSLASGRLSVT
jgi:hypothetical protein